MTGWTTSYRWNGVTRSNVVGLIRHDVRDVDLSNGVEVTHSNRDIDPSMTALNETMVNDGTGRLIPCTKAEQWIAFLDRRIAETGNTRRLKDGRVVPVAVRKDASVAVEFVLQLDPEFTGNSADLSGARREEVDRLMNVMIEEVVEVMGAENVIGYSKHWDEGRPHVQLMAVPVTDDGRLSMKGKLGAPKKIDAQKRYTELHDQMRDRLRKAGYDATDERVDLGKRHLGLAEFKRQRDLDAAREKQAQQVAQMDAKLDVRIDGLAQREDQLDATRAALEAREAALAEREAEVERLAQEATEARAAALQASQKAAQALEDTRGVHATLETMVERQSEVPTDVEAFFKTTASKATGETIGDRFQAFTARRSAARAPSA